jgi:hypothetical protein
MPDVGGSLSFTTPRHGITDDLREELAVLFDRMVVSQGTGIDEPTRRDDVQVWRADEKSLKPAVSKQLRPKSFATKVGQTEFPVEPHSSSAKTNSESPDTVATY